MVASAGDVASIDRDVRLAVYRRIVEEGWPPTAPEVAGELGVATPEVETSLRRLADGRAWRVTFGPGLARYPDYRPAR